MSLFKLLFHIINQFFRSHIYFSKGKLLSVCLFCNRFDDFHMAFIDDRSFSFSVGDVPSLTDSGARMSPTASGDNVILTFRNSIYTLEATNSTYQWMKKKEQLSISRLNHIQLTVPSTLTNRE